eukprot:2197132-Karenia_brevis.AAC.1
MESLTKATEGFRALWQTTWPHLTPRILEAVASPGWSQFLMKYPRTPKLDGSISKINFYRIVELLDGLRDSKCDVAVLTVPEAWIPTE